MAEQNPLPGLLEALIVAEPPAARTARTTRDEDWGFRPVGRREQPMSGPLARFFGRRSKPPAGDSTP